VRYVKKVIGASLLAGLAWGGAGVVQSQAAREWRYYGGDHAFTRYSPLDQINRDNVKNVKIACRP
jgi:glucose dehydrogenase